MTSTMGIFNRQAPQHQASISPLPSMEMFGRAGCRAGCQAASFESNKQTNAQSGVRYAQSCGQSLTGLGAASIITRTGARDCGHLMVHIVQPRFEPASTGLSIQIDRAEGHSFNTREGQAGSSAGPDPMMRTSGPILFTNSHSNY